MYGINIKPFLGLVHTDDAIALKQIAAALKVEDDLEEIPNVCCKAYSLSLRQTRTHMRAHAHALIYTRMYALTHTHTVTDGCLLLEFKFHRCHLPQLLTT